MSADVPIVIPTKKRTVNWTDLLIRLELAKISWLRLGRKNPISFSTDLSKTLSVLAGRPDAIIESAELPGGPASVRAQKNLSNFIEYTTMGL